MNQIKKPKIRLISLNSAFFIFLLFIFISSTFAQNIQIGTYIINAGKFDQQTGSYSVDFYLSLKCDVNCSTDFEFVNGRAISVDKIIDKPDEKFYRILATLQNPVDFRKYPFDSHELTIEIEDKTNTKDKVTYVVDGKQTGLEPNIQFIGWKLVGSKASIEDHYYPPYDETYSKYKFSINLEREKVSAFLKIFVPVLIIMLLNFFAHFPDPDKITTRILMHSTFLTAAVMFHVAIGNQLPPLGYLNVADKFMFACYISLGFSLTSAIAVLELSEEKRVELVKKVHRSSGLASFVLWIISIAFVLLTM
ncbi:hypothetical protein HY990_02685 [Candidatus Micrarchaeota archaeon]|nr:hypothetical protein [Candidatus Micrarchaeota archaeon]